MFFSLAREDIDNNNNNYFEVRSPSHGWQCAPVPLSRVQCYFAFVFVANYDNFHYISIFEISVCL